MVRGRRPSRLHLESLEDRINPNASLNILGGGLQIVIAGPDTVNLSTVNGDLVVNDSTAGQTITDTTGKFTVAGAAGNQTATENASLIVDFTSLTITGNGGGQAVNFTGGSFVATNVNDGTIPTVGFANALSSFSGDLKIVTSTSLTVSGAISGTDAINMIVGGTNAALNVNANVISQKGPVTLQATGAVAVASGVAIISTYGSLTLGADLTPADAGDDGIGILTIGAGATVYGTNITTRGADVDIAPTASMGSAVLNEEVPSTFAQTAPNPGGPAGLACDASGNLYIADNNSDSILKVTPGGVASTFCANPSFSNPAGLAFDSSGNLYVANWQFSTIYKISPAGVASIFVAAELDGPEGLAFDSAGNLYVANNRGNTISEVTPAGVVSTFVDITHGLDSPYGLAFDAGGNLYVGNYLGSSIFKVTPGGSVSTFYTNSNFVPTLLASRNGILYVPSLGTVMEFGFAGGAPS